MADQQPPAGTAVAGEPREDGRVRTRRGSVKTAAAAALSVAPRRTIRPVLVLLALVNLAWSLYQYPLNRLLESRLCHDHYAANDPSVLPPHGRVPEELCKLDEVQQALGRLQRTMETAWVAGDFVMTIPLVSLAELYGRRHVLWLNIAARVILLLCALAVGYFDRVLPVAAIVVGPMFSVLGGDCVFNSIMYSLVSSLTDDHVLRATFFGYTNAVSSISASQLGPALASGTMSIALELPLWIGVALLLLAIFVVPMLPSEPSYLRHRHDHVDDNDVAPLLPASSSSRGMQKRGVVALAADRFRAILDILTYPSRNFSLLLCCFFCTSLASSDTKLLPQYISKRYGWTFASVGYLLSSKAVLNFVVLTFVIPLVLRLRQPTFEATASPPQRQEAADRANINYAHICLAFSALGAAAIALSPTIWLLVPSLLVYGLGIALPMFTYSLLKSPALGPRRDSRDTHRAGHSETQIFSIVMLVKTVGALLGALMMPSLWIVGIRLKGILFGLPFLVSGLWYVFGSVTLCKIRTR
ncbi:major facilitator superfamily domain-containing protein [Lasiosphaeria ovina]|uniref:Major facilitator superfamily domain-containing protein n=1 Tax=Lasiosphaeria ovina TaxID=92902 RepID=A0AAE0KHK3_9PEZI|nr:major facilitator superfamily domain-containing protein [Lasiosphaeria ovina]